MSECIGKYFIRNEISLNQEQFEDSYINEGVSLYEVIRVIEGVPLFLDKHLARLTNSAELVHKQLWLDMEEVKAKLFKLIKINGINEGNIKIVFNTGEPKPEQERNYYAYFIESHYPAEEQYKNGVSAVFCFMERNNPKAKIINKELREETNRLLRESGAYEAILVDRNEYITEGSRSNIFMVKGDKVITAPLRNVLPGITRDIVIEICISEGICFEERSVAYCSIEELDALFISGTSPKILPINKINDFILSSSTNIIVQNIMRHYNRIINNDIKANKV